MEKRRDEKSFRLLSFATHATRGVIRDQRVRRTAMIVLIGVATVMALAGATVLRELLNPREHAGWFIVFWLGCAWLTFTALLLAMLDLLLVRVQARAAQKAFQQEFRKGAGAADQSDDG